MKIGVIGIIGYEWAKSWALENEERLRKHFPDFFMQDFFEIEKADVTPEKISGNDLNIYVIEIGEFGIFGSLWEICDLVENNNPESKNKIGCRVSLNKIPIRQEVVEVCELADVNPYEISSKGSFLVAGEELPEGVALIGTITMEKARVIEMGVDEKTNEIITRFLTPPKRQAKDLKNHR